MNYLDRKKLQRAQEEAARAIQAYDMMSRALDDAAAQLDASADLMARGTPDAADADAWAPQIARNRTAAGNRPPNLP